MTPLIAGVDLSKTCACGRSYDAAGLAKLPKLGEEAYGPVFEKRSFRYRWYRCPCGEPLAVKTWEPRWHHAGRFALAVVGTAVLLIVILGALHAARGGR